MYYLYIRIHIFKMYKYIYKYNICDISKVSAGISNY